MAEHARQAGALRTLAYCYSYIGTTEYLQGKFKEAIDNLLRSATLYREINAPSGEAMVLQRLGVVRTATGEWDQALSDLHRALDIARGYILQGHSMMRVYATLARNRLEASDYRAALDYAKHGLAIEEQQGRCLICGVLLYPAAAMAYGMNGDIKEGRRFATLARDSALEYGSKFFFGLASQSTAMIEGMAGCWDEAFHAINRAEEAFSAIPQSYEVARTRFFRAYLLVQRHAGQDLALAREELQRAEPVFVELGAAASAAQAHTLLLQLSAL
jgi:tetratricopeptide (TPR) repeat protein